MPKKYTKKQVSRAKKGTTKAGKKAGGLLGKAARGIMARKRRMKKMMERL